METEAVDLPDLQLNLLCETFDTNVFFFFFSFFFAGFCHLSHEWDHHHLWLLQGASHWRR